MNTEIIFKLFLGLHILGGGIGLIAGTINMFRPKGDATHKLAGKFFFYGMLTAATAALILSSIHQSYFLFITGVFTIYMVSTGQRYLLLKGITGNPEPKPVDWALSIGMLIFGGAFVAFGVYKLMTGTTFGMVFIVSGGISLGMVRADIRNYTQTITVKSLWLTTHLQRMTGAYIAATTAFLVVNLPHQVIPDSLSFVPWLLPTAIVTPLIFKWSRKYTAKPKEVA